MAQGNSIRKCLLTHNKFKVICFQFVTVVLPCLIQFVFPFFFHVLRKGIGSRLNKNSLHKPNPCSTCFSGGYFISFIWLHCCEFSHWHYVAYHLQPCVTQSETTILKSHAGKSIIVFAVGNIMAKSS